MPLNAELKEIVDEMEFDSDEERAAFEKIMEGKAGTKIKAGYMKAKDYTTKTQALAQTRTELEAARKKFEDEQDYVLSTTSKWKEDVEKRLNAALKQVEESDLRGAALTAKLRSIAATYGEDPEELLRDIKTARSAGDGDEDTGKTKSKAVDDDRFVTKDDFGKAANAYFGFAPMIRDFERDYRRTFGKEYDGSITELVTEASSAVEKRRARGENIDIFGYMKEKLDFSGQVKRNEEAAKLAAEEEKKKWQEEQRKEIEQNVRSEYLAANPGAMRKEEQTDDWRKNIAAKSKQRQQQEARHTPTDTFKRQQEIHRAYEEQASKSATG